MNTLWYLLDYLTNKLIFKVMNSYLNLGPFKKNILYSLFIAFKVTLLPHIHGDFKIDFIHYGMDIAYVITVVNL